ncbi:hypothetical protein KR100_07040 [Synechococcus sp. KORDI-100]|nr:hypothetical protein KR100_07040 [Synechococcus sp. KORDI-100]
MAKTAMIATETMQINRTIIEFLSAMMLAQ